MTRPDTVTCKECGSDFAPRHKQGALPKTCYDCKDKRRAEDLQVMRQRYDPRFKPSADGTGKIVPPTAETVEPSGVFEPPVDEAELWQPPPVDENESHMDYLHRAGRAYNQYRDIGDYVPEGADEPEPLRSKVEDEPSWLDAPDIQERIAEKNASNQSGGTIEDDVQPPQEPEPGKETWARYADGTPKPIPEAVAEKLREMGATDADLDDAAERVAKIKEDLKVCVVPACGLPDPRHPGGFCTNHWQRIDLDTRGVLLGAPQASAPWVNAVNRAVRQLRP